MEEMCNGPHPANICAYDIGKYVKTREGRLTLFVYVYMGTIRVSAPVGKAEGQGRGRRFLNNSCSLLRASFAVGAFDFLGACGL